MQLLSYEFVAFTAAGLLLFYTVGKRFRVQWVILLLMSLAFYAGSGWKFLIFPISVSLFAWSGALLLDRLNEKALLIKQDKSTDKAVRQERTQQLKKRKRRVLVLVLLICFGILAVVKYTDFALSLLGKLINLCGVPGSFDPVGFLLPLGISYYTFQAMGYLIDVYRGSCKAERSFWKMLLFVMFFPQMVSGPISRYDQIQPELIGNRETGTRFPDREQLFCAGEKILMGLLKKLVIAERMSGPVMAVIGTGGNCSGTEAFLGMIGFTLWMYADFSGGIDIVLGTASLFGVRLPENFNYPFTAQSLADFWTKWHMTLMQWMRDYVFYPAATSKTIRKISKSAGKILPAGFSKRLPAYLASFVVWFITGIWHGASEKFLIWGMANFAVMTISQELTPLYRRFHGKFHLDGTKGWRIVCMVRTFLLFSVLELFECYPVRTVFSQVFRMIAEFDPAGIAGGIPAFLGMELPECILLAAAWTLVLASAYVHAKKDRIRAKLGERTILGSRCIYLYGLFLITLIMGRYGQGYEVAEFFYNQF